MLLFDFLSLYPIFNMFVIIECPKMKYDGDLDIDHLNPLYMGGKQRIIFVDNK